MGRPRRHHPRRLHRAQRPRPARRAGLLGRGDARAPAAQPGPGRRGPLHPGGPRPGHARGQAPGPRPPRLVTRRSGWPPEYLLGYLVGPRVRSLSGRPPSAR
jgi:hypothetical protein